MKDTIYNALNLNGFFSISKKQSVKLIKEVEKAIEKQTVATYPPIANFNWFEVTD